MSSEWQSPLGRGYQVSTFGHEFAFDERGIDGARGEGRRIEDALVDRNRRVDSFDDEFAQGSTHDGEGLGARRLVDQ